MSFLGGGKSKASSPQPQYSGLRVQQSSYGTPLPIVYGVNRISGNLLWYDDFKAVAHDSGAQAGKGGGGGGGKGGGAKTYTYSASFIIGICEGPAVSILAVWENKTKGTVASFGGYVATGAAGQAPWPYMTGAHPTKALGYSQIVCANFANKDLGQSAETPNFSYLMAGILSNTGPNNTAKPASVISDFLQRAAFPAANIGDLSNAANYWQASNFYISPVVDSARPASEYLQDWISTLNAEFVWSDGLLKVMPYADSIITGGGITFIPNLQPVFDLEYNDYLVEGADEDPLHCSRTDLTDAYNQQPLEFHDSANEYNIATVTYEDSGHIEQNGIRTAGTVQAHHITNAEQAKTIAQLIAVRGLSVRRTFTAKLGYQYFLLDPMDYVTLTDSGLGLNRVLALVKQIDEDEEGVLSVTFEEVPGVISGPALIPDQPSARFTADYNAAPGNANAPFVFEPPLGLLQSPEVQVWIGISGFADNWAGCYVWVSTDGDTYRMVGEQRGAARQGALDEPLANFTPANGSNIDQTNSVIIDFLESNGDFQNSATPADATSLNTVCYVGGELIAYGSNVLVAPHSYRLSYLVRGCYGSKISAHNTGDNFLPLDSAVFKLATDQSRIGQKIYLKLQSFNQYGGGLEDLSTLGAFEYTVTGEALLTPLPDITAASFTVSYTDGIAILSWSPVSDIRNPIYEVRKGATFESAQVITRTALAQCQVYGSDTYYVTPLYFTPTGIAVYSTTPPSITITAAGLPQNLIQSWDENATGWTGTLVNLVPTGGYPKLVGAGDILSDPNVLAITNVLYLGGVASSGSYTIPSGHQIASAYVVNAKVVLSWDLRAESLDDNVLADPDILSAQDILGVRFQPYIQAVPQIRLSTDNGATWGAWFNWVPGYYQFNKLDARLLVFSSNSSVTAVLQGFTLEVDTPLRTDTGNSTSSAGADVTVTYAAPFNVAPQPQITVNNKQAGDDEVLLSYNANGFTYKILNAGARVVRAINWQSTSY